MAPKLGECQVCGTEKVKVRNYDGRLGQQNKVRACRMCANTHALTAYNYPEQYPDGQVKILAAISVVGNIILKELKK